jgi:hypothetical protein
MASNTIKVVIDVVADKAASSLKNFKTTLADTEGSFGKMKVAGSAAFDQIKANAANMAVAAGGALVAFAAKAVGEFQALALEAGKFSDATGIAVEDASRWIEVAGDMGVSGEAVQGAFQKMNKAIADGKLDEFAADVVKAKDGTVDASATFENLVTKIGAIKDPTERAAAAQKAFGKGYAEIAEMMEMSAGDLEKALKGVSDSKVIDESELGKARKFRDAMDNLRDKTEDLALTLGESLVPALTDVAEVAGTVADALGTELPGGIKVIDALMEPIAGKFRAAGENIQGLKGDLLDMSGPAQLISDRLKEGETSGDGFSRAVDGVAYVLGLAEQAMEDAGREAHIASERIDALKTDFSELKGEIEKDDAWLSLQEQLDLVKLKGYEAFKAAEDGASDAAAKQNDYTHEVNATALEILGMAEQIKNIPSSAKSEITAAVEKGDLEEAYRILRWIEAENGKVYRTYTVHTVTSGGPGYRPPQGATGGIVTRPTLALIGEAGPEAVVPLNRTPGSSPLPTGGTGGGNTVIFAPQISAMDAASFSPAFMQRLMNEFERTMGRTGRVWARQ